MDRNDSFGSSVWARTEIASGAAKAEPLGFGYTQAERKQPAPLYIQADRQNADRQNADRQNADRQNADRQNAGRNVPIPDYLQRIYWWTYIHPLAVKVFDHQWVVNLILLTQYNRMRSAALAEFDAAESANVLQVTCAYGDLTPKLVEKIATGGGHLDIVDVLPIQLKNTARKLQPSSPVSLYNRNAADLGLPSATYDKVMIFFLLHEVPSDVRTRVLHEAFRVLKPGGKLVLAEFAMPKWWNPFRYLWAVFLSIFEPFALDMWRHDIGDLLPAFARKFARRQDRYFGGLFQKTVVFKD